MPQRKTGTFTYELLRSDRRTLSMQVSQDGAILVRVPRRLPAEEADRFVEKHEAWITKRLESLQRAVEIRPSYTDEEKRTYRGKAAAVLEEKCRIFADRMGITYGRITVREQKTRWGSCSAKGNLNFNWKLVLMPEAIIDYLVVHELAHRKQMNHSPEFWKIVETEIPDYWERRQWLKIHGAEF